MAFGYSPSEEDRKKREKALQKKKAAKELAELRSAQGEHDKMLKEKEAFISGAEKKGGFLGIGGSYSDGGESKLGAAASLLSGKGEGGALEGAAQGAQFGPKGALIGAGVGAVKGILGASEKKKKARAAAEAGKQQQLGRIEGEKEQKKQQSIQNLMGALTQSMIRGGGKIY
jgi:hypothetical protein